MKKEDEDMEELTKLSRKPERVNILDKVSTMLLVDYKLNLISSPLLKKQDD